MMVKASCGCKGILLEGTEPGQDWQGSQMIVIEPCDGESDIGFFVRGMEKEKTFTPLEPEDEKRLIREVRNLVADGHNYRQIKCLLRD